MNACLLFSLVQRIKFKALSDSEKGNEIRRLHGSSAKMRRGSIGSVRQRRLGAASSPQRQVSGCGAGKALPSKWVDAERWLINSPCNGSPAQFIRNEQRVGKEEVSTTQIPSFDEQLMCVGPNSALQAAKSQDYVKDKLAAFVEDGVSERAGFPCGAGIKTEMNTVYNSSPARHNTPANQSGHMVLSQSSTSIAELDERHFGALALNWFTREDEEKDLSTSLRHFEECGWSRTIAESRACTWEDEERIKSCIRYHGEEAKVQALVNLQTEKAEAERRKLEVKIQKMTANLEEKLMRKMASVQRKAEEWRAAAKLHHSQEILRLSQKAKKTKDVQNSDLSRYISCSCFSFCNHSF